MTSPPTEDPYLRAVSSIPRGRTRSFLEVAALAGRPGAARAAGRTLSKCPEDSPHPWHRVVAADGKPRSDRERPRREELQWKRLRREGARPRLGERISRWAVRVGAAFVGDYRTKEFAPSSDPRVEGYHPERVEAFGSEGEALARGFSRPGGKARESEPLPSPGFAPAAREKSRVSIEERLEVIDWRRSRDELASRGSCRFPGLLTASECASILTESSDPARFDRSVAMEPRGFGVGSYHYYKEPLLDPAGALREGLYRGLRSLACELWPRGDYPETLEGFWSRCRDAGQTKPSSILICYGTGGVNHPHRDLYGRVWFPFQALLMLAERGRDFEGGELVLLDDVPGAEPRKIPVTRGDVTIFCSRERFEGSRRIAMRHGMSPITRGKRYGLGMVFHLAE